MEFTDTFLSDPSGPDSDDLPVGEPAEGVEVDVHVRPPEPPHPTPRLRREVRGPGAPRYQCFSPAYLLMKVKFCAMIH